MPKLERHLLHICSVDVAVKYWIDRLAAEEAAADKRRKTEPPLLPPADPPPPTDPEVPPPPAPAAEPRKRRRLRGKQSDETAGMDIDAEELPPRWSTIACGHFKVRPISAAHLFGGRGGKLPYVHMPRLV